VTAPPSPTTTPVAVSAWPANCPPADAVEADGVAHRIVSHDPPTENDLRSHAELGLAVDAPECLRRGVSLFSTRQQACHRLKLSRHLDSMVASATLQPAHGKVTRPPTKNGHFTWWSAVELVRHVLFQGARPCP